ncbi:MAG: ParB N-terminal domain-containing protein [Bacteroidia bacterium]
MKIQIVETTDYKLFRCIEVNRPVNPKHVEKLKKEILKRNMLHLNPIIVDPSHNIIDGQHRLQAAKELKLPIYYLVDSQVSEDDISILNSNKSNWSAKNYIEYYAKKGVEAYITIKKLIEEFPKISYPVSMELLNNSEYAKSEFREGKFIAKDYDFARSLLLKASDFDFYEWRFEQRFLRALKQCVETGEYVHEKMIAQMKRESGMMRLKKCYFHDDYILMLEDIYNFKQQTEIANFRLTKAKRQRIEAKKLKENKPKILKPAKNTETRKREKNFAKIFLADNKVKLESQNHKNIAVKIDDKTTIMVAEGTDIVALKKKYANRNNNPTNPHRGGKYKIDKAFQELKK